MALNFIRYLGIEILKVMTGSIFVISIGLTIKAISGI